MNRNPFPSRLALVLTLAAGLCAQLPAAETPAPSQSTIGTLVTVTGEVTAIDVAARQITLRGPLGGEVSARVNDEVKNLPQVKTGDMVTIAYYQSIALSAAKKGEPNPLFTGGDAATSEAGKLPAAYVSKQTKRTVTVVAVDAEKRAVVLQGESGALFPVEVERPEFAQKLRDLRVGDQIDIVLTEAVIAEVTPASVSEKPSYSREVGTLIVERGEVLRRFNNVLYIRNERGRTIKATVDPSYKFQLDGKEATVFDISPGAKLTKAAFRVVENVSYEGE